MLLKWTCTRSKPWQFWPAFFSFTVIYPYTQTQESTHSLPEEAEMHSAFTHKSQPHHHRWPPFLPMGEFLFNVRQLPALLPCPMHLSRQFIQFNSWFLEWNVGINVCLLQTNHIIAKDWLYFIVYKQCWWVSDNFTHCYFQLVKEISSFQFTLPIHQNLIFAYYSFSSTSWS